MPGTGPQPTRPLTGDLISELLARSVQTRRLATVAVIDARLSAERASNAAGDAQRVAERASRMAGQARRLIDDARPPESGTPGEKRW